MSMGFSFMPAADTKKATVMHFLLFLPPEHCFPFCPNPRSGEANAAGSRVHTTMTQRPSEFEEVNKALYEWYLLACSKNIYPGGAQLTEKAKEIAERFGKTEFKGSRGWLDKWKKRYNVKQLKISGESGDVRGDTVDSWKERLPEIVKGYDKGYIEHG